MGVTVSVGVGVGVSVGVAVGVGDGVDVGVGVEVAEAVDGFGVGVGVGFQALLNVSHSFCVTFKCLPSGPIQSIVKTLVGVGVRLADKEAVGAGVKEGVGVRVILTSLIPFISGLYSGCFIFK